MKRNSSCGHINTENTEGEPRSHQGSGIRLSKTRLGSESCDRHVCRVTAAVVFRGFGRQGGVHCHKVRGTKPGEEAAGGVVMAVREAGFNSFPFLLRTMDVGGKISLTTFYCIKSGNIYTFKTIAFFLFIIILLLFIVSVFVCCLSLTNNCTFASVIFLIHFNNLFSLCCP